MGQCAITPPSNSEQQRGTNEFLVVHRPDRPARCILDREEVDQALLHQAEEMERQERERLLKERIGSSFSTLSSLLSSGDEGNLTDATTTSTSVMSTVAAPSVLTNKTDSSRGTDVTRLVSNLDRYAMTKPKFRRKISSKPIPEYMSDDEVSTGSDSSAAQARRRARRWKSQLENGNLADDSSTLSRSDAMGIQGDQTTIVDQAVGAQEEFRKKLQRRVEESNGHRLGVGGLHHPVQDTGPLRAYNMIFGTCLGPQLSSKPKMREMEARTTSLNLRMEAKLVDYYLNQYLKMFPDSPTPNGLSPFMRTTPLVTKSKDPAPNLISVSSDGSSSTPDKVAVDFFAGVPSSPVFLAVDGSAFLDMAVTGSLGLVERNSEKVTPTNPALSRQQKSPEHYIVLINRRSGIPLAICALKSQRGSPIVRIYTTKPRVFGQRPAATTDQLGIKWSAALPLFAWAEIVTEGEFPMPMRYSIYMSWGSDGRFEKEPSYRASHASTGSPDISVVGRTEAEEEYSGCATVSVKTDAQREIYLAVSVSRGIDPGLFICFAAIADEIMEKYMRLQCELLLKTEARRSEYQREF